jgi:hypothetical protein
MVVDGRSREGYEREVIKQVRDHGGFSIFWVTENQKRAHAATRLVERGVLAEDRKCSFPWHSYKIIGEK